MQILATLSNAKTRDNETRMAAIVVASARNDCSNTNELACNPITNRITVDH